MTEPNMPVEPTVNVPLSFVDDLKFNHEYMDDFHRGWNGAVEKVVQRLASAAPEAARVRDRPHNQQEEVMGLVMKYFVLKPEGDDAYAIASRRAMFQYSKAIMEENPEFSKELWDWTSNEHIASCERRGMLPGQGEDGAMNILAAKP